MGTNQIQSESIKTLKICKWLFIATLVFSLIWLTWISIQTYNQLFTPGCTQWKDGYEWIQTFILILYWALPVALIIIQVIFFLKLFKSLKNGTIFNPSCTKLIFYWGIIYFFYSFVYSNAGMGAYGNFNTLTLDPSLIAIPIMIFIFGFLYSLATKVSEENSLTI